MDDFATGTDCFSFRLCVQQVLQRHHPADVGSAGRPAGHLAGRTHHPHQLPVHPAGSVAGGESGAQEAHPGQHHR